MVGIKLRHKDWEKKTLWEMVEFEKKTNWPAKWPNISNKKDERFKYDYLVSWKEKKYTDNPTFDWEYISIWDGWWFNIFYENWKFWASWHNFVFSAKKDINLNNKFLYYNLLFLWDEINKLYTWIWMKNIKKTSLTNVKILLPPLEIQNQIVSYLDKQFEKIQPMKENLEKYKQEVEKLKESILEEVFGKMKGKYEKVNIKNISENVNNLNKDNIDEYDNYKYIDINSIDNKKYIILDSLIKNYSNDNLPVRAKQKIKKWDILFSLTRPYLKNIAIVNYNFSNLLASTAFYVFRVSNNKSKKYNFKNVNNKYVFYFFISNNFINLVNSKTKSDPPAIPKKDFEKLYFSFPPLEIQNQIVSYLDKQFLHINRLKDNIEKQQENIENLKKALLNEIFGVVDEEKLKDE